MACGPILDFDYDVAILFSDILFPLELFGLDLSYNPGPVFGNYLQPGDENKTISVDKIQEELSFQSEAMALTRKALPENKSLKKKSMDGRSLLKMKYNKDHHD